MSFQTCYVKLVLGFKTNNSRDFAFATRPEQVCNELVKLIGLELQQSAQVMQEVVQVLLTVSVLFSDIIFRFAVYCFINIASSVGVSLSEKSKDSNLKESIDFRVRIQS